MKGLLGLAAAAFPAVAGATNYLGPLKPPQDIFAPPALYSFATSTFAGASGLEAPAGWDNGVRLKLGYRYSRYLSIESEFSDSVPTTDVFASPTHLGSAFRSSGFGVDTVATLPVWGFSFYGRMGAWHGERAAFAPYSTALLGDGLARGTRWRYGLGVRYDVTRSLGIRAEVERYSAAGLGSPLEGDADAEQLSVGFSWRF